MCKAKGKHTEKDIASITMADISSLLDEHRAALSADFKSSFESLASTLDSIHSTITDHGQRNDTLETNTISADQRLQHLEDACSALQKDNESLKLKVADLEGRSRCQNVRIIGLPESIEGPRPTVFFFPNYWLTFLVRRFLLCPLSWIERIAISHQSRDQSSCAFIGSKLRT